MAGLSAAWTATVLCCVLVGGTSCAAASDGNAVKVSHSLRISPQPSVPHMWWRLRADPTDGSRMAVCALINDPANAVSLASVLYGSEDGGKTWRRLSLDAHAAGESEAECLFDDRGRLYYTSSQQAQAPPNLITDDPQPLSRLIGGATVLRMSTDFGRTWTQSTLPKVYVDASAMADDPHRREARVLMVSDESGPLSRTIVDGRIDTATPVKLFPELRQRAKVTALNMEDTISLPGGGFGALFAYADISQHIGAKARELLFLPMDAQGRPVDKPVTIAAISGAFDALPPSRPERLSSLWEYSFGKGAFAAAGNTVYVLFLGNDAGRSRIFLAQSHDSGRSWSVPRAVDDSPAQTNETRDRFTSLPAIAISSQGVIGVQWAEFAGRCWRFSFSADGGRSFSASVPVNPCDTAPPAPMAELGAYIDAAPIPTNLERAEGTVPIQVFDWRFLQLVSRANGLAALPDGAFQSIWSVMGGGKGGLYTSRLTLHAAKPVDEWSGLKPAVSRKSWIDYASLKYDETLRELCIDALLVTPAAGASWPLYWRLTRVESPLGTFIPSNADNGLESEGAIWAFAAATEPPQPHSAVALNLRHLPGHRASQLRSLCFKATRLQPPESLSPIRPGYPHHFVLSLSGTLWAR